MASNSQKRDIADFFRQANRSIPAKRPSPSLEDTPHHVKMEAKSSKLQTPATASRFNNVTSSPVKSPFRSGTSVKVPIRSPRPRPSQDTVTSFSSALSAHYKDRPVKTEIKTVSSPQVPALQFSFADLPSSTQSVVKDGKVVAVRGSEDEDSDSLESLDEIFGRRKDEPATSSSSPPDLDADTAEAERLRSLFLFTSGRSQPLVGRDKLRELNAKERDHKVDIGSLVGAHFDDDEIEGKIAKAKGGHEALKQEELLRRQEAVDERLLASVVAGVSGEPDDMSRLMSAVERTEALSNDKTWSFFGSGGLRKLLTKPLKPPTGNRPNAWAQKCLQDKQSRDRSFLSGYVGEAWQNAGLRDNFIEWTLESITRESRDELRRSYVQSLAQLDPGWIRTNMDAQQIEQMFLRLGASQQSVDCKGSLEPTHNLSKIQEAIHYKFLLSTIEVLTAVAPNLTISALEKLLAIMVRIALDASLMSDTRLSLAVEDSISELMDVSKQKTEFRIARSFVADLGSSLEDSTLQAQLLKHIPCTSFLAAAIRVQLANHFLLDVDLDSEINFGCPAINLKTLTAYLYSGPFDTTVRSPRKRPDYTNITSLTYLLDIAIADGGRPASFPSRVEERSFNSMVDVLADRVKSIFSSIVDTGASHMRRTEAKEALQALHYRLLYAVRTEPRPKKNVFGGRDGEEWRAEERSKSFMTQFLGKKEKGPLQESNNMLPNDSSQASKKSESEVLIRRQLQLDES